MNYQHQSNQITYVVQIITNRCVIIPIHSSIPVLNEISCLVDNLSSKAKMCDSSWSPVTLKVGYGH